MGQFLTQIGGVSIVCLSELEPSSTFLITTDPSFPQPEMHDLRRLLKYLRPHWPIFSLATVAMLVGSLLEAPLVR
jgi:hypothetical protein